MCYWVTLLANPPFQMSQSTDYQASKALIIAGDGGGGWWCLRLLELLKTPQKREKPRSEQTVFPLCGSCQSPFSL